MHDHPPTEPLPVDERRLDIRFHRWVATITAVGALWRLLRLLAKWNVPLQYGDAWYYSIQAINNAHGRWFKEAQGPIATWGVLPGAEHPPLTSVVLAPASLLSHPEFWQRATMTVIGIAVVPLIALVGRRLGGRRAGVIAAALAALYPNLWLSDALVMSETLVIASVVVVTWLALRHHDRFTLATALMLGAAIGVAGHARSEILLYAPLLACVGLRSHAWRLWLGRAGLVLGATALTVTPWFVYNSSRFNAPVLMSTNEGSTWQGANCSLTYHGPGVGGWNLLCLTEPAPDANEDASQRSQRRRHEAFTFMRANITRLPVVVAARALLGADLWGWHETIRADVGEERPRWAIWAGIVCWLLLAPLAAVGWRRLRRGPRFIVAVPAIGVAMVTLMFYGSHRLRAPLEPMVVLCAALFLANLPRVRRLTGTAVRS